MLSLIIHLLTALPLFYGVAALSSPVQIVDSATGRPVPFGSIGVKNTPIGTVADSSGRFAVETLLGAAATDTVVISCVGFRARKVTMAELVNLSAIKLLPQAQALTEVMVHSRPPQPVVLGHRNASSLTSFGFYTQTDTVPHARLGREMGVLLKVNHPTKLQSFHLLTFGRDFKTVTFRLNIYSVQNGLPQNTLLRRDIIFTVKGPQRGWTKVDLRPYRLTLDANQQVVAAVEWLANVPSQQTGGFLNVPGHVSATHSVFTRDKSAQGWRKLGLNPNMYFMGLTYP